MAKLDTIRAEPCTARPRLRRRRYRLAWQVALLVALAASGPTLAQPAFREVAEQWGIRFRHHHGGTGERLHPETIGSGVALLDFDQDGDLDILFVDSGALEAASGGENRSILWRNDGAHRFVDVTERVGIELDCYGMGVTAADVDEDGDLDLYFTCFGENRLLVNDGHGSFMEGTKQAGLGDSSWSTGATFADTDQDGDLDLFVTNYFDFSLDEPMLCGDPARGINAYCHPDLFEPLPDTYFRNEGGGRFTDRTVAAGFSTARGRGLAAVFADFDLDGFVDLFVANDLNPNLYFRNRGDGTFEDLSLLSGAAYGDQGTAEAGMGIGLADIDGNGQLDLYVTNFALETNAMYLNQGAGLFIDGRFRSGLAEPSIRMLGFGAGFADFDQDGDLDLAVANGHILDNVEEVRQHITYAQPNQLFENLGAGRFRERPDAGLDKVRVSRGLAIGDLDADGDPDLVITNSNQEAEVYENVSAVGERWILIDLEGSVSNRQGLGSRLELRQEGRAQSRVSSTGSSYLSQSGGPLHFGLGSGAEEHELVVSWPRGSRQIFRSVPLGRRLRLREPEASEQD